MTQSKNTLNNENIKTYSFLEGMAQDEYFPSECVHAGKEILIDLCHQIESGSLQNLAELYKLTNRATEKFNLLQDVFFENGSEIDSVAAEIIALDFHFIAETYGFKDANIEELVASREW